MPKLDRYLIGELAQATFATLTVLLIVSFGGVFADVLKDIAAGRVPVGMMVPQLGLLLLNWLPLILPMALLLGLMLGIGRLYRDSEMPVLASIGVGPPRLLRPLMWVAVPIAVVVAVCSLWLGPWAERQSKQMVNEANRNLIVAGLQPGTFTEIPGGGGVIFVGSMSTDGSRFRRVFVYRQSEDRLDVITSNDGELTVDENGERFLTLNRGFEVEGPLGGGLDYRLLRYARNQVHVAAGESRYDPNDPELLPTLQLLGDPRREAMAQVHARLAPPLMTLAFALLAVPLARSTPRQARYGPMLMGFLAYLVSVFLARLGTNWLADGKIAGPLGLWWMLLPLLAVALWLYFRDGRVRAPRLLRRAAA